MALTYEEQQAQFRAAYPKSTGTTRLTYEEQQAQFRAAYGTQQSTKADNGSWLKDTALSTVAGIYNTVGTAGYLVGADAVVDFAKQREDRANAQKSEGLHEEEAELSRLISAGDYIGAAAYVAANPSLLSSTVASSLPASLLGGGIGGLVGKALLATKSAVVVNAAGNLTRVAAGTAAGVGEGAFIAADVYKNTDGNAVAGAAGGLLGIVTNILTPGNFGTAITRRLANTTDEAADVFAGVGAKQAVGRLGVAGLAEGAQELGQETGQALIEQGGRGEALNFNVALAQGAVGALAGHAMGTVAHPLVGRGSAYAAKQTELGDAQRVLAEIEKAGGNSSVMQATVNKLTLETSILSTNTPATPVQRGDLEVLSAKLVAARNPSSSEAQETADTLEAINLAGKGDDVAKAATEMAVTAGIDAIQSAKTLDEALSDFGATAQASSVGRVGVAAARNMAGGIAQSANEAGTLASANLYSEDAQAAAEADVASEREQIKTEHARLKFNKEQVSMREHYNDLVDTQFEIASNPDSTPEVRAAAEVRIVNLEAERDRFAPLPEGMTSPTRITTAATPSTTAAAPITSAPVEGFATGAEALVIPRKFLKRVKVDMPVLEADGTVTMEKRSALAARESLAKQKSAYEALRACIG